MEVDDPPAVNTDPLPDNDKLPSRKKFKYSELPLTQTQRSAVDNLVNTFKKKGEFDAIRKNIFARFEESDAKQTFISSLTAFAESELERNPSLLGKDRKQAAPLIAGAAERSDVYATAEAEIDRLIDGYMEDAEQKLREIRLQEVGPDVFAEEERRGSKTDEDYAHESRARRQAWAKTREEELAKQRAREEEERKKRAEEQRRKEEEAAARERERQEQEEKSKREREAWEREMEERRERKRRQDAEWERERMENEERERQKREKEREKQREKDIEEAALEELIREGKQLAARSARNEPVELGSRGGRVKESALASIMRQEMLENERAKAIASKDGDRSVHTPQGEQSGMKVDKASPPYHPPNSPSQRSEERGQRSNLKLNSRTDEKESRRQHEESPRDSTRTRPEKSFSHDGRAEDRYRQKHDIREEEPRRRTSRYDDDDGSVKRKLPPLQLPTDSSRRTSRVYDMDKNEDRDERRQSRDNTSYQRQRDARSPPAHRGRRSRSRSPAPQSSATRSGRQNYRQRSPESPPATAGRSARQDHRERSRSREKPEIDRYVPSTSHRSKTAYERRDAEKSRRDRTGRDQNDGTEPSSRVEREYDSRDQRPRDRVERGERGERGDRGERPPPVKIDRYKPGMPDRDGGGGGDYSSRASEGERRRNSSRGRDKDRGRRSRSRSKEGQR